MYKNASFRAQLSELTSEEKGKALFFQFKDIQIPNLKEALEAPVCEFVCMILPLFLFAPYRTPVKQLRRQ
jgi:hypothetical protein